jgi:hypothetical protein
MHHEENRRTLHPAAVVLSLAAVFVADLMIGPDVLVAVAYIGTVLACIWCGHRRGAPAAAAGATVFVVIAAIMTGAGGVSGSGLANFVLVILAIWMTALAVLSRMHDDLGQTLAVAKMRLELLAGAEESTSEGRLAPIVALIDAAHRAVRTLTFQIIPPVLHDLGFTAALECLVDYFKEHFDLDVTFDGDERLDTMDERMHVVLFRPSENC